MLNRRVGSVLILIAWLALTANAQSYDVARDSYERGRERFRKGDFDGAINDFTRAIEISSRPAADRSGRPDSSGRF